MSELDAFETRFTAAYRRYLDEVPTEVDAAAVVRTVTAAHPRPRASAWSWSLRPAPALAWLMLLALLLAALGAAAFFMGSQPVQRLPAVIWPVSPTASTPATYTAVSEGTYVAVSVGGGHTCAIRTDGNLECWGRNLDGEATPHEGTYVAVSAAVEHTCAIRADGTLECWGSNAGVAGATPGTYSAVSDTCAIRTDGTLTCWGPDPDPWPPPPAGTYVAVSSAGEHACAIRSDGTLTCWGQDYWGQATPPEGKYVAVSARWWHACAIRTDGMLTCWASEPGPPPPAGSHIAVSASMPDYEACAIRTDGKLACWGSDWIARTKNMGGSWNGPPTALIPAMGRIYPAREAPERRRGTVEFGSGGSGRIITTPSTTFSVGDTIRFAASLEREVRAGEAVTIALSVDGGVQGEVEGRRDFVFGDHGETSRSFDMPGDCIGGLLYWLYAAPPWSDLSAFPVSWTTGHYRLELSAGGKVLAEGEFGVGP